MFSVSICNVYLHYHVHLQKNINGKIMFHRTLILLLSRFESMNGHVYATNNFTTCINEQTEQITLQIMDCILKLNTLNHASLLTDNLFSIYKLFPIYC